MQGKALIIGLGVGVLAWAVYRAQKTAAVDTASGEGGGIAAALDGFVDAGFEIAGQFMPGTMEISLIGLNQIKQHEGFRSTVYNDIAGYPTIGYGHKLTTADKFAGLKTVTEQEAVRLLAADLASAEAAVNSLVNVPITQNQFDALVSFVYNIGAGAFRRSTMLSLLNRGQYDLAALQFGRWNKAGGKVSDGLSKRRASEYAMFTNGQGLMTA